MSLMQVFKRIRDTSARLTRLFRPSPRRPMRHVRPSFELLEDRTLLTTLEPFADTFAAAAPLTALSVVERIDAPRDVDLFRIQEPPGIPLTISLKPTSSGATPGALMYVFDANGVPMAVGGFYTGFFSSPIQFVTTLPGTYYIGVSGLDNQAYNPTIAGSGSASGFFTGNYELDVTAPPINNFVDDHFADTFDTPFRVQPPTPGVVLPIAATINTATDVDAYVVHLNAGQRLRADLEGNLFPIFNRLNVGSVFVFSQSRSLLGSSLNSTNPFDAVTTINATYTGDYFVVVGRYANFTNPDDGTIGAYRGNYELDLLVSNGENLQTQSFATAVKASQWGDDIDVSLDIQNLGLFDSATYQVEVHVSNQPNQVSPNDLLAQFVAQTGELEDRVTLAGIAAQSDFAGRLKVRLPGSVFSRPPGFEDSDFVYLTLVIVPAAGTIQDRLDNKTSPYFGIQIAAAALEAETNDSQADAQQIALNSNVRGIVDTPGDVDWFQVTIPAFSGGRLRVRVVAADGSELDPQVSLYGPTDTPYGEPNNLLATSDDVAPGDHMAELVQHLYAVDPNSTATFYRSQSPQTYYLAVSSSASANGLALGGGYVLTTEFVPDGGGVGQIPNSLAVGDFNHDGFQDVATADFGSGDVSVLLGTGDGSLGNPVYYHVGNGPVSVVTGDFNGDGELDLAVANQRFPEIRILGGFGDGTFALRSRLPIGFAPSQLASADFNGDGRDDLVLTDLTGAGIALAGQSDGTLQLFAYGSVNGAARAVTTGDFDHDGIPDVAILSASTNLVSVFLQHGGQMFDNPQVIEVGKTPLSITAGDFNGDGFLDLATTSSVDNTVTVLMNQTGGVFKALTPIAVDQRPVTVVAADINGDGRVDLVVTNSNSADFTVLLNRQSSNQEPTFVKSTTRVQFIAPVDAKISDFNGDGRLDLAVLNGFAVTILPGQGDGTFNTGLIAATDENPVSMTQADFNGDGIQDLAVVNKGSNDVSILIGNKTLAFDKVNTLAVGKSPVDVVSADFNGDGRADLAVVSSKSATGTRGDVRVYFGQGDATFRASPDGAITVGNAPTSVVVGQFVGDGLLDLAVTNHDDNTVTFLRGLPNGGFEAFPAIPVGGQGPQDVVSADFNGDGRTDLAFANTTSNNVTLLLGRPNDSFSPGGAYDVGPGPVAMVVGYFNSDAAPDLAVINIGNSSVSVLLGIVGGGFQPQAVYEVANPVPPVLSAYPLKKHGPTAITAADFTADKITDLVVANYYDSQLPFGEVPSLDLVTLRGRGDGTFEDEADFQHQVRSVPFPGYASALAPADLTGDGEPDLVLLNGTLGYVDVYFSSGAGSGSASSVEDQGRLYSAFNAPRPERATPLFEDVNGDGVLDSLTVRADGDILYRKGRQHPGQPLIFDPPITINLGTPALAVALVNNNHGGAPLIAAISAQRNQLTIYAHLASSGTDSWRAIQTLDTDVLPSSIAAGDLNSDGRGDIVISTLESSTVQIFLAQDDGSFRMTERHRTGSDTTNVALIDVDGDSALDIVAANGATADVTILLNDGAARFVDRGHFRATNGNYATGSRVAEFFGVVQLLSNDQTTQVLSGDFNQDGEIDLVAINRGARSLSVLFGKGGGTFVNPQVSFVDGLPLAGAVADFDGDGHDDLAILTDKNVQIFSGTGGLHKLSKIDAGDAPSGLEVKDMDGDGKLDLLIGNSSGDVLMLFGKGDGTFQPYQRIDQNVALAVTKDNRYILTSHASDQVSVLADVGGTSTQSLQRQDGLLAPSAGQIATVGDRQYLVVANSGANEVLTYPIVNGQLFTPFVEHYSVGTDPAGITIADFNSDEVPDIVVTNRGSNDVSILIGKVQGPNWVLTAGPRLASAGSGPVSAAVADVTGPDGVPDGNPDILVSNSQSNNVTLLPGVGNGFFDDQNPTTFATGANPGQVFVGSFTTPGQMDFAVIDEGSNDITLVANFTNNPSTRFLASGGETPGSAVAGDFNGDNIDDLLVANVGDGAFSLFFGDLDGLRLSAIFTDLGILHPTDLALASLSDGTFRLLVAQAGEDQVFALDLTLPRSFNDEPAGAGNRPQTLSLTPLGASSLAIIPIFVITGNSVAVNAPRSDGEEQTQFARFFAEGDKTKEELADQQEFPSERQLARGADETDPASRLNQFIIGTEQSVDRLLGDIVERLRHGNPSAVPSDAEDFLIVEDSPADPPVASAPNRAVALDAGHGQDPHGEQDTDPAAASAPERPAGKIFSMVSLVLALAAAFLVRPDTSPAERERSLDAMPRR